MNESTCIEIEAIDPLEARSLGRRDTQRWQELRKIFSEDATLQRGRKPEHAFTVATRS